MGKKDCNNTSKTLVILMSVCVALSIITLGIVIYDRFIREEPEHVILKPIEIEGDINDICSNRPDLYSSEDVNMDSETVDLELEDN